MSLAALRQVLPERIASAIWDAISTAVGGTTDAETRISLFAEDAPVSFS